MLITFFRPEIVSYCDLYTDREKSENEKRRKSVAELPAKNRRVWTASFTLVDKRLDQGSPGGLRQTNYCNSSPLRKLFECL